MRCKSGPVRLPQSSGERRLEKKNDLHFCKSLIFKWYHQELYFIYKWLYIITFQKRKKGNLLLLLHLEFALFCASLHGGFLLQR